MHAGRVVLLVLLLSALPSVPTAAASPAPPPVVTVCHKPGTTAQQTLTLPAPAAQQRITEGDRPGPCHVDVTPVIDSTRAVTANIGDSGGTLAVSTASGASMSLQIPARALDAPTSISATPIVSLAGAPAGIGLIGGLQLGPDGTRLSRAAHLTLTLPAGVSTKQVVGFGYSAAGQDFHLVPPLITGQQVTISLVHFSGAGIAIADAKFCASPPVSVTSSSDAIEQVDCILLRAGNDPTKISHADQVQAANILEAWIRAVVRPSEDSARKCIAATSCTSSGDLLSTALQEFVTFETFFSSVVESFFADAHALVEPDSQDLAKALSTDLTNYLARLEEECRNKTGIEEKKAVLKEMLLWEARADHASYLLQVPITTTCDLCAGLLREIADNVLIGPSKAKLEVGQSVTITATFYSGCLNAITDRLPSWTSSGQGSIATVTSSGRVFGLAPGTATITASLDGISESATVEVIPAARVPTAILILPGAPNAEYDLQPGASMQLTAVVLDQNGAVIPGQVVTWTTSDPTVASIDVSGRVVALGGGQSTIGAHASNVSTYVLVVVQTVSRIDLLTLIPLQPLPGQPIRMRLGATLQLIPFLYDQNGAPIASPVDWTSSNSSVASVSTRGLVTALSAGNARITARSGGASAFIDVSVRLPHRLTLAFSGDGAAKLLGYVETELETSTLQDRICPPTCVFDILDGTQLQVWIGEANDPFFGFATAAPPLYPGENTEYVLTAEGCPADLQWFYRWYCSFATSGSDLVVSFSVGVAQVSITGSCSLLADPFAGSDCVPWAQGNATLPPGAGIRGYNDTRSTAISCGSWVLVTVTDDAYCARPGFSSPLSSTFSMPAGAVFGPISLSGQLVGGWVDVVQDAPSSAVTRFPSEFHGFVSFSRYFEIFFVP